MEVYTIGSKDFIRGESSSENVADGGFSPKSYNLNLTRIRGVLDFAPGLTDRGGGTLTDVPIASAYDKTLSGNDAYFLDVGGGFYTLASDNTFTKRQTITADTFILGTSEILQYSPAVGTSFLMATSQTRVIRFTGSNLTSAAPDTDFWTGLTTAVRHPHEIVEGKWYLGDGNLIHVYDGTTTTASWVVLPPDVNITSLRKHPDGQHLLAFCGLGLNYSHTRNTPGRVYIVDLVARNWIREIDTDAQVEGSRLVGGIVYVTYGKNFGYFNGNGLSLLKRLATSITTYSHNIGNMEDIVVVRDGQHVRAYGDLGAGKVWWRCAKTSADTDGDINNLIYRGDNRLLICYQDSGGSDYIKELDYDDTSSTGIFYHNRVPFATESIVRRIEVNHKKSTGGSWAMTANDTEDTSVLLSDVMSPEAANGKTRREVNYKTDIMQYRQGQGPGEIKLIRIFYDPIKQ